MRVGILGDEARVVGGDAAEPMGSSRGHLQETVEEDTYVSRDPTRKDISVFGDIRQHVIKSLGYKTDFIWCNVRSDYPNMTCAGAPRSSQSPIFSGT